MLNFDLFKNNNIEIKIRETHRIGVYKHPIYRELNPILSKTVKQLASVDPLKRSTNVKANMTDWFIMDENIAKVIKWTEFLITKNFCQNYIGKNTKPELKLIDCWGIVYGKNDYAQSHTHDVAYSFVYYVNSPKGSSPLIFDTSGKKIKAEEGNVIIMPGNILHSVPKNKCNERIVIAGNFNFRS